MADTVITPDWQDYATEVANQAATERRNRAEDLLEPQVTQDMAVRAAEIARMYPTLPGGIVGAAAFAGLDYTTPQLLAIEQRYAKTQDTSVGYQLTRPLRFLTRALTAGATSAIDELVDRPVRTFTRMAQQNETFIDAWRRAGQSTVGRIGRQHALGQPVNLGTGYLAQSTDPFKSKEFYSALNEGATPQQAAETALNVYGTPLTSQASRVAESTQYISRWGTPTAVSLGRIAAVQVFEPGTAPFHLVSGAIDLAKQLYLDPAYGGLAVLGDVRAARRVFQAADFADQAVRDGLIARGVRKTLHAPTVEGWLAKEGPGGGKAWVDLLTKTDDIEAVHVLAPELTPAEKLAIAQTSDPAEVLSIVRPALGLQIREVPATLSRVSRTAGKLAAFGDRTAMDIAGVRGLPGTFKYRMVDNPLGRALSDLPRATLEVEDSSQAFANARDWMVNAKFPKEIRRSILEKIAAVPEGDYAAMYKAAAEMMHEYKRQLVRLWGGEEHVSDAFAAMVDEFTDLYIRQSGIRAYTTNALGQDILLPGAGHITLDDGTKVPIPTPSNLAEMASRHVLLPDPYDVLRAGSRSRRITDAVRRATPGLRPIFEKESIPVRWASAYQSNFWKPMVLLRPAWTVRVVGEELLRIAAAGYSSIYNHPMDYLAWTLGDRILAPIEDIVGRPVAKGRSTILKTGEDTYEAILDAPFHQQAMSKLRQRLLSKVGPEDARQPTGAWGIYYKNRAKDLNSYKEGIAREFLQLRSDPVYRQVADVGVEDTLNWLRNTDEGRDVLTVIQNRAAADTPWTDIVTNEATQRLYVENAHFRIHVKSGGKGYYRDGAGIWHNERGSVVPEPPVDVPAGHNYVVTEAGHPDLVNVVKEGQLGNHTLTDNLAMKEYRGFRDYLYDNYKDVLPEATKGPVEQQVRSTMASEFDRITGWMFRKLGENPTNYLSRSPALAQMYWDEVARLAVYGTREVRIEILKAAKAANVERELLRGIRKWGEQAGLSPKTIKKLLDEAGDLPPPKLGSYMMRGGRNYPQAPPEPSGGFSGPPEGGPSGLGGGPATPTLGPGSPGGAIVVRDLHWAPLDDEAYAAVQEGLDRLHDIHHLEQIETMDDLRAFLNTQPDLADLLNDQEIARLFQERYKWATSPERTVSGTYRYRPNDVLMVDRRNVEQLFDPARLEDITGGQLPFDPWDAMRQYVKPSRLQIVKYGYRNPKVGVAESGILEPLTVAKRGDQWVLKDGYVRTLAAQDLNIEQVPIRIDDQFLDQADEFVDWVYRNQNELRLRKTAGEHPNGLSDEGLFVRTTPGEPWTPYNDPDEAQKAIERASKYQPDNGKYRIKATAKKADGTKVEPPADTVQEAVTSTLKRLQMSGRLDDIVDMIGDMPARFVNQEIRSAINRTAVETPIGRTGTRTEYVEQIVEGDRTAIVRTVYQEGGAQVTVRVPYGEIRKYLAAGGPMPERPSVAQASKYFLDDAGNLQRRATTVGEDLLAGTAIDDEWVTKLRQAIADRIYRDTATRLQQHLGADVADPFDHIPSRTELSYLAEEARHARTRPRTAASAAAGPSDLPPHGELDMLDLVPAFEQQAREQYFRILNGQDHVVALRIDPNFTGPQRDLFESFADSYGWARYELDDGSVVFLHPNYKTPADITSVFNDEPGTAIRHVVDVNDPDGWKATATVVEGDPPPPPPPPKEPPPSGDAYFENLPEGTLDDIGLIDELAKNHALSQVQNLLYDLSRKHGWTAGTRLVFPFGEAWGEVISRWAQLFARQTKIARRAQQIYEGARNNGFVYPDEYGNNVFAYPFVGRAVSNLVGGTGNDIRLTGQLSGLNLVAGGLPGSGPILTAPASLWYPPSGIGALVKRVLFPYGAPQPGRSPGEILFDAAMPAYMRRFLTGVNEEDGSFARAWNSSAADLFSLGLMEGRYHNTRETQAEEAADVRTKNRELFLVRAFLQWIFPTGPGVEYDIPLGKIRPASAELQHPVPTIMTLRGLALEYSKYRAAYQGDDVFASKLFLDNFGVDPLLRTAKAFRTGQFNTQEEGFRFWLENADLFEPGRFPATAAYAHPDKEGGNMVWAAYLDGIRTGAFQPMTLEQYMTAINQQLGDRYMEDKYQKVEGLPQTDAIQEWLRNHRYAAMDRWPGFGRPNVGKPEAVSMDQKIDEFKRWSSEPRLAETDAGRGVAQFLTYWNQAEQEAVRRGLTVTGWRTAAAAADLQSWLQQWAEVVIAEHPDFRYIWESTFKPALRATDDDPTINLLGRRVPSEPPTEGNDNG